MQTMGQGINLDCCFEVVFLIHACAFPLTYLYPKKGTGYSLFDGCSQQCNYEMENCYRRNYGPLNRISSFCSPNLSNGGCKKVIGLGHNVNSFMKNNELLSKNKKISRTEKSALGKW